MLLFIHTATASNCRSLGIQIHLMLLFIEMAGLEMRPGPWFKYISCYCLSHDRQEIGSAYIDSNTSHVIVYRSFWISCGIPSDNSNTSHVIVYLATTNAKGNAEWIQIHLMLLFIYVAIIIDPIYKDSNTSHVIVYLMTLYVSELKIKAFKYISCYCLSLPGPITCWIACKFKYISCYCLS